jgi:hypothetical protein
MMLLATPAATQTPGTGHWTTMSPLPFFPTAMDLLPNGKVLFFGGDPQGQPPGSPATTARAWDPATGQTSVLAPPGYDLFCTGHAFLPDGRLLLTGGHISNFVGLPNASIYNAFANTWTRLPRMNAGRWYPTNTTLANGDVLVLSGQIDTTVGVDGLPQVFSPATNSWRALTGAQLSLDLYPRMHLAPNGRVFNSGPSATTRYLDTSGTGAWSMVGTRPGGVRDYASAVMYDTGKILFVGGGDPPTRTAAVIDLNESSPAWRTVASMATARRHLNATLLPNGKVLVTGGTSGSGFNDMTRPVFAAELWDPATERWTTLASQTVGRFYHSVALLLPDGRVVSAGGNGHPQVEVFSPPYLTGSTRPTITSAPGSVSYGQSFSVQTPNAAAIRQVTWVRLPAVTHAFDQNQRFNHLRFTAASGGLTVTAPGSATIAPPGHYMLFILDGQGVPSVARIVRLGGTGTTTPPPPSSPPPTTGTLTVSITQPTSGATVKGTSWVTLWLGGSTGTSNVYTITVAGHAVASSTTSSRGPVTLGWNSTTVGNGSQTLIASARDSAGHTGSASIPITVSNAGSPPPSPPPGGALEVSITQPSSGAAVRGTVWATVWLGGSTGASNTYTLSVGGRTVATQTTSSTGPVSLAWVTTTADNGARTLIVTARDAGGHTGSGTVPVTVRN